METTYWESAKPLFDKVEIGGKERAFKASIKSIPRPLTIVWAAHFCLSEVHNGGLVQFVWNSTGMIAPEAIDGFEAVGMSALAAAVKSAASVLGTRYPRVRDDRWDALLAAGGLTTGELEAIFTRSKNLYISFAESTRELGWDKLNKTINALAEDENGGFGTAATQYLRALKLA